MIKFFVLYICKRFVLYGDSKPVLVVRHDRPKSNLKKRKGIYPFNVQ